MAPLPEKKKRKSHKSKETVTLTLKKMKTLGQQLLSSRSHINNLPILLSALSPSSRTPLDLSLEALISLQSFFVPILPEIPSKSSEEDKDPESVYRSWLRTHFDEFVSSLIDISVSADSEEALRDVAFDAIMDFVKLGKEGKFQSAIYHRFLQSIVHTTSSSDDLLLDLLASKYFKYIDVRYFTYMSLDKIARNCEQRNMTDQKRGDFYDGKELSESRLEIILQIIYTILSRIPPLQTPGEQTSYETWSHLGPSTKEAGNLSSKTMLDDVKPKTSNGMPNEAASMGHIMKKYKLKFTKAWLSFLKLPLSVDVYKQVLATLHQNVVPYISNPAILCDFLTRSYDIGGVISVMALNGLFILMTQHGLEYHNFYEKLYTLLTPAVFMAKHRASFFQLLDTCLKSSHLPAYLAAAFAKKLSRLSLSVPPSGALVIIAIIHNLLRRHPSINFLVQQQNDDGGDGEPSVGESGEAAKQSVAGLVTHNKKPGHDPFMSEESDPFKCNAMRSSLWEIDTLRNHYCPAVSRFVASLETDLTVRAKTSEITVADFSSGSYATIFREETRRRIKQVPVAFYGVTPNILFSELDFPGWTFEDPHFDIKAADDENGMTRTVENSDTNKSSKRQRIESI